jgi:hypothetical protein
MLSFFWTKEVEKTSSKEETLSRLRDELPGLETIQGFQQNLL